MAKRAFRGNAPRWERRRLQLLGPERGARLQVAAALGISLTSLKTWEVGEPPRWYDLALVGLAHQLQQEAPDAG